MDIESLNELAGSWGRFIGAQVVDSTIVLLLVAAIWFAVRRRVPAQFGYCLFLLVLLKTVVPGQLAIPVTGVTASVVSTAVLQTAVSVVSPPVPPNTVSAERSGEAEARSVSPASRFDTHVSSAPVSSSVTSLAPKSVRFALASFFPSITVLMLVWASLASLFLGRLVYTEWHTRRLIRRSKPVHPDTLPVSVDWLMQTARLRRRFSVCESRWAKSPLVCGLFSPVLVLPKGFFIRHTENQVCWILLHELAHLRRRDPLTKLFQKLIQCVFFFHPAVWIANWAIDRQREFACDADAVTCSNLPRRDCGEGFLTAVLQANNARTRLPDPVGLFNSKFLVKERLMRILSCNDEYRTGLTFGMTAFLFALALCVMPFTGCTPLQAQESETPDFTFVGVTRGLDHSLGTICHVLPIFERLDEVRIVTWYGPHGEEHSTSLTGGEGYSLINGGRSIKITAPVHAGREKLVLIGKWKMPWMFRALKPIEPGTTRILLGDHICKEGVDFEVNEMRGLITVLKPGLCDSSKPIRLNYRLRGEPITPRTLHTMFRGDRGMYAETVDYPGDESVLKRFMGMPQDRSFKGHDFANVEFTIAHHSAEDPDVYLLRSPVLREELQVCFVNPNKLGERFLFLTEGIDYQYDAEKGRITLISDKAKGQDHLCIQGGIDPSIMNLNRSLEKPATATLNGRSLKEGVGFTVDYKTGLVKVLDPAIYGVDVEFKLTAGNYTHEWGTKPSKPRSRGYADADDYDPSVDRDRTVGTNAVPTDEPMVYCLAQAYQTKGFLLGIGDRKKGPGHTRWLKRDEDYTYEEETGRITFLGDELPFDPDNGEWVFVSAVPHLDQYFLHDVPEKGGVSVEINGKELEEGVGFTVDYETGKVVVLDPAVKDRDAAFRLAAGGFSYSRGGSHSSKPRSRGFAEAEDYDPRVDTNKCVGTNATPTGDPMVFSLYKPFHTKGLIVAIGDRAKEPGDLRWLKRDRDYTYDEEEGLIAFLGEELPFDDDKGEWVFVHGAPYRHVFDLPKPVEKGTVSVTLNGEELTEGEGFTVDYETGRLTVLDPAIQERTAKYNIVTPSRIYHEKGSQSNSDTPELQRNPNTLKFSECEDYDPERNFSKSIGAGVSPTDDPYLYTLSLKMKTKGLLMGVTRKDMYGVFKWLKRDRDYTHNEAEATITLLKDDLYDRETERLFISGIPEPRNVHLFHKPLEPGSVQVTLDGRDLTENEGFTVDYAKGTVTLTDPRMSGGRMPECRINVRGVGETEEQSSGIFTKSAIFTSTSTGTATKSGVFRGTSRGK